MTGFLALEDGTVFRGESVGAEGFAFGEAVFTTAMTGYQEVVTDPSYSEQLVAFTAPMVGNYGVEADRCESRRPHARAVVMREARGPAWTDWLHDHGLVALSGIDTRSLVVHLREAGAMRAIAVVGEASVEEAVAAVKEQPGMAGRSLATGVSTPEPYVYSDAGTARIAVVDYGCKRSILDRLAWAGAAVTVYPHDADPGELARFDGVLLSNGPGDPEPLAGEVETVKALLGRVPVFGGEDLQAPLRAPRRQPPGAGEAHQPRARHEPESRLRGRPLGRARGDARLALRRHGRRARVPGAAGALGAVPPGGAARPARRVAAALPLGRGGGTCRSGVTSARSA